MPCSVVRPLAENVVARFGSTVGDLDCKGVAQIGGVAPGYAWSGVVDE